MTSRLSKLEVAQYLNRLQFKHDVLPNEATLCALHVAHLRHIPFENFDIRLGRALDLNTYKLFEKLIIGRRGGICYELNGLLSALLRTLGFAVSILSARVFDGNKPGPDFDHLLLLVLLGEKKLIVDVGFGDAFLQPLDLGKKGFTQKDSNYAIDRQDDVYVMIKRDTAGEIKRQYAFHLEQQDMSAFNAMCHFHQISIASHFTQKSIFSIANENGRTTISNGRLIKTNMTQRSEWAITDAMHFANILQQEFACSAQASADLSVLFSPSSPIE